MPRILLLILSFVLISCETGPSAEMKRRNLGEYFVGTGVIRYFLTELPNWANFSQSGKCTRGTSGRYFKIDELRRSFSLSFEETIQFQYMFNHELNLLKDKSGVAHIPFKDEENLFYQLSDKIQAGIRLFKRPKYKRVHIIWIDRAISDPAEYKKLKKLMKTGTMGLGYPVFVSLCMSRKEMDVYVAQKFPSLSVKKISFEIFSPYDENNKMLPYFSLNFDYLFKPEQQLYFYIPTSEMPLDFRGNYKVINF